MNDNQLELKHARERALVAAERRLPEGKRTGELRELFVSARQMDKLLTRYDGMDKPPAIAEQLSTLFAAQLARIDELTP